MRFDPRAQWDSTRLFNRLLTQWDSVGLDPRAQWDSTRGPQSDSTRGPEPFDREWRPIRRLNRRSNRLFSRLFDHASHGPVEPRCAHHTTPRSAHTSPNTVECKGHRPQNRLLNAVLGECGPRRRALPLEGLQGRAALAPFRANFGPHCPY